MDDRFYYSIVICSLFNIFSVVIADTLKFKLNDGYEIPAVSLGTSLGHLSDSAKTGKYPPFVPISPGVKCIHIFRDQAHIAVMPSQAGIVLRTDGTRIISVNNSLAMAVEWALGAGYRHIDTASLYRTEDEVGIAIRRFMADNNIPRQDIYVTTKLWNDAHNQKDVVPALKRSLEALKLDYVDLYLIHFPMAYAKDGSISDVDYLETWRGMEEAKRLNLTRSIGVSNFNSTQLARLYQNATIKPAVLQIEVNPSIAELGQVEWCKARGIIVMAYSPFGAILGRKSDAIGPKADDPTFLRLSQKYGKTVPQILLRYLLDRGIVAIPRSTNKQRIEQNIDLFDFSLTPKEVTDLNAMNVNYRLRVLAKWYSHPYFPYEKKNLTTEQIQYLIDNSKED